MNNDFLTPENENTTEDTQTPVPEAVEISDDVSATEEVTTPDNLAQAELPKEITCDINPAEDVPEFTDTEATGTRCDTQVLQEDKNSQELDNPQPAPVQYYNPGIQYHTPVSSAPQSSPVINPKIPTEAPVIQPADLKPAKKNRGATAFLVILWVLVGLFATGFFGLCGYVIGISDNNTTPTHPTLFDNDEPPAQTEPATKPTESADSTVPPAIPLPEDGDWYSQDSSVELKAPPADKTNSDKYTTQYAYKKVAESTIGVVCYEEGFSDEPASEGTGIILTADGYIATNSHVIGDSRTLYTVQVITNDGEKYSAKVIGYDSRTDIAVLKIGAKGLTPAEFCDSKYVEVGQDVIAVGNPGGMDFQNSLTRGVVSALNRELSLSSQVSYIQTDAAINPGNSGGPLSNMYGQVVGINTAKISSSSYEGMGFAIPSATVKEIADDLISHGYVSDRVRLGISGQAVTSAMKQYYDIPLGILVGEISKDGPCDNTELQINDVITELDGETIESFSDVYAVLAKHKPGDKIEMKVYRMSTKSEVEMTIILMADEGETQQ